MRIVVESSILLSLLTTGSSLSVAGFSIRTQRDVILPRTIVSTYTAERSTQDVVDVVTTERSRKRRRRKSAPRPLGAPTVDSSLLRFISSQKRIQMEPVYTDQDMDLALAEIQQSLTVMINDSDVLENSNPEESVAKENDNWLTASMCSWMAQFNRNRVAQVLMTKGDGLDEKLAKLAGDSVQKHVLARSARRRVRQFLKVRDTLWLQGERYGEDSSSLLQPLEYGFDEVVDLLLQYGLTGKDIATILIHTPSVAVMMPRRPMNAFSEDGFEGETLEETVNRAFGNLLCGSMKLRRYDARKVLRTCPGLLTMRGSKAAEQVVNMLVKLGVSTNSLARDKRALPILLSRSPSAMFRLVAFLSSNAVRMPLTQIGPLLRRSDCLYLLDAVAPVPRQYKDDFDDVDEVFPNDADDAIAMVSMWGQSTEQRRQRVNEIYDKMSSTAWTLRNEIGTKDLGKVIAAYPGVLLLDASEQILPTASYLMKDLGIWKDDLGRVLQLYPALLGRDIEQMQKVVSFFLEQGVAEENIANIFRSFPKLLTMDVENDMTPVVTFLQKIGIQNVGRFLTRLPPVVGYSLEREIIPKWEYLKELYPYETFELTKFPAFLSYPLERVIKARFEYLNKVKGLPIQLIALDLVLRYGDRDFATRVAGDKDGGKSYAKFLKNRNNESLNKNRRKQSYKKLVNNSRKMNDNRI